MGFANRYCDLLFLPYTGGILPRRSLGRETLLGRDSKYDFDALPRRNWMANFYLPLSPRTHDQVPRCLLCSPIT